MLWDVARLDWAIEGSDTFHPTVGAAPRIWAKANSLDGLASHGVSLNAIDRPDNQRAKKKAVKLSVQSFLCLLLWLILRNTTFITWCWGHYDCKGKADHSQRQRQQFWLKTLLLKRHLRINLTDTSWEPVLVPHRWSAGMQEKNRSPKFCTPVVPLPLRTRMVSAMEA